MTDGKKTAVGTAAETTAKAKPAAAAETVEKVKAEPVQAETEETAPVKAAAKKPGRKAAADKTAAKATAKTTGRKPGRPSKKDSAAAGAAKTTAKKEAVKETMNLQFSGKSYATEDLMKIAKDVWKYDLKQKVSDLKSIELYVKPEENVAYYVMNGEVSGSFYI